MTYRELFQKYFCSYGYANFILKYSSLLIGPPPNRNEEAFFKAMAEDADRDSYDLEMALNKVSQLTQKAFRTFKVIVGNSDMKDKSDFLTIQTALHESMFKTLYHLDRNCRKLLKAQMDCNKHDDLESYLKSLSKKHGLSKEQLGIVGQKWFENSELTYNQLVKGEYHLRVYDWEPHEVCFQIEDNKNDNMLKAQAEICTSNGLLFSKYYFVVRIVKIFEHLHLITQILELEKTGDTKDDNLENVELEPGAMNAFNQAAQEFLDK
jgi:hypothetical protein